MKEIVRAALVQLDIIGLDPEKNLAHMRDMTKKAVSDRTFRMLILLRI